MRRRVALKIIKLGMDTKAVVARFEAERQALAMMDHPNIARVLDGGATDAGRPYFVMELVRGVRITEYCDEARLSTRDRLDLFIQVCQAIQHAHQKGIIHRDIKPSNILVTVNDGVAVPKVIDFGIAKATEGRLTDKTLVTQFEALIGTPAYMSPEQTVMTSVDIDTRSDIYSLGVLLYELLAGTDAVRCEGTAGVRTGRDAEDDPRAGAGPAEHTTGDAARRGVDDDRQTPVIRHIEAASSTPGRSRLDRDEVPGEGSRPALRNGQWPRRRSQRHLNNEPVLARPPSAAYRFQKLVRRNKLVFAARRQRLRAVLVLGVIVSTWQAIRATNAKREAVEQRQSAFNAAKDARQAEQKAEIQRNVAVEQRKFADMQLALQAWEEGDLQRANDLIDASRPAPGQTARIRVALSPETLPGPKPSKPSAAPIINTDRRSFFDHDLLLLNDGKSSRFRTFPAGTLSCCSKIRMESGAPTFCSGNTNLLATLTDDGRIKVWDLAARRVRVVFEGHHAQPNQRASSRSLRDGKWLASASSGFPSSSDNSVKLWACRGERSPSQSGPFIAIPTARKASPSHPTEDNCSRAGPKVGSAFGMSPRGRRRTPLEGHTAWVGALATSPDGLSMASGAGDSTVIIWNVIFAQT